MKARSLLLSAFSAVGVLCASASATASTCSLPPTNFQTSGDAHYSKLFACRGDYWDFFVDEFEIDRGDWDEGFGWETPCDASRPMGRAFNALYALQFSSPNPIMSGTNYGTDPLRWGGIYARNNLDELDCRCPDPAYPYAFATTGITDGVDLWTRLYMRFFYEETVAERAGTLVHEATHAAGYPHAANNCPNVGNCDLYYPSPESPNSFQVMWLASYSQRGYNATWLMKDSARDTANAILDGGFNSPAAVRVFNYPDIPLVGDLNFDQRDDLVIFRQNPGTWHVLDGRKLATGVRSELVSGLAYGMPTDQPLLGDVDGDHFKDLIIYRTRDPSDLDQWYASGYWFAYSLAKGRPLFEWVEFGMTGGLGIPDDVPLVADVNKDGAADLVIFEPRNGTWWALSGAAASTGSTQMLVSGLSYGGLGGDTPVVGDFDKDGAFDFGIFRPFEGTWHAWSSFRNMQLFTGIQFGENGDIPIVADFSGDGVRDDLGLYRPRLGEWDARGSLNAVWLVGPLSYGGAQDRPLVGRFSGMARVAPVIYRPYEGTWHSVDFSPGTTYFQNQSYGAPY